MDSTPRSIWRSAIEWIDRARRRRAVSAIACRRLALRRLLFVAISTNAVGTLLYLSCS